MIDNKIIKQIEKSAEESWNEFMMNEDFNDSTEYLHYKIYLLQSKLEKEREVYKRGYNDALFAIKYQCGYLKYKDKKCIIKPHNEDTEQLTKNQSKDES